MRSKIQVPEEVVNIFQELELNGHSAYLVGGYVRDQLLNMKNKSTPSEDFDIACSATPKEIKSIFVNDQIFNYGERHGTVIIRRSRINYEITTFREEEGYSDGRRPDKVTFIRDLSTDLARRDFTVNAFAANKDGTVIDYFNGLNDLENKIIRAVGDPVNRLREDSLRIFRAIRFAVKLGFNIENETKKAIVEHRHLILEHRLSGERIFSELNKILKDLPRGVMLLHDLGLLQMIFRGYGAQEEINWLFRLLKSGKYQQNQPTSNLVNWSILLHFLLERKSFDEIPPILKDIFTMYPGFKIDKIDYITHLVQFVRCFSNIVNLNDEVVRAVVFAVNNALNVKTISDHFFNDVVQLLKILDNRWGIDSITNLENMIQKYVPKLDQTLPLGGKDLVSIGYNGTLIGIILKYLNILFNQDAGQDRFHLLDYINKFQFDKCKFDLTDYLAKFNLNPDETLEEFVKEALLYRMKIEYQLVVNPNKTIVIEIQKEFIDYVRSFLNGLGEKTILINSHEELAEEVIEDLNSLKIKHIRFKFHSKELIDTLLDLSLSNQNTVIFNVK